MRPFRRIPGSSLLVVIPVLLLCARGVSAQGHEPDRIDVAGLVADASTGEPLAGAAVAIEGTAVRTLTNEDGRFILRGVPRGEQVWRVERLGYATWEQPFAARHLDQLRIGLMARPVALEEIRVTVDRLEARRKQAQYSVHTVDREALRSSPAIDAADLVRSRMHWVPAACPGGGGGGFAGAPAAGPGGAIVVPGESTLRDPGQSPSWGLLDLCIRHRGNVTRPGVCLDDRPIPLAVLAAYAPEEIYAIDYVDGPGPQVRLYTLRFLESGRPIRPLAFGCR